MPVKAPTPSDRDISAALGLLELLTEAPGHAMSARKAAASLGVDAVEIDKALALIDALSDSHSGLRIPISRDGELISLIGDAGEVRLIRLDGTESIVLSYLLKALNIDGDVRRRLTAALCPLGDAEIEPSSLGEPGGYGSFYQRIAESIEDGARLVISYRSSSNEASTARTIDPGCIVFESGRPYLIAWDLNRDEQRRYRLDRIADVTITGDSVERHAFTAQTVEESLTRSGSQAEVLLRDPSLPERRGWRGFRRERTLPDGAVIGTLSYGSEAWLFGQVLSAGGTVVLLAPDDVRRRLVAFGSDLLDAVPDSHHRS